MDATETRPTTARAITKKAGDWTLPVFSTSHTVHFALARRGNLKPGETVLVMGAGGGVGTAAIQVAAGLGARVIAGVSSADRVDIAVAAGAAETIVLESGFSAEIRERTGGRGVDMVLDPVGDWLFDELPTALEDLGKGAIRGKAVVQLR